MSNAIKDHENYATSTDETETYPTPVEKQVKGSPGQNATTHFEVEDKFCAGECGAEEGIWIVSYSENEYFHILSGKSILRDNEGNAMELNPGDKVCVPAGFEGEWEVIEPTQKIFVIYEP